MRLFNGVYSIDNLPQHPGPKLLVANTDTSDDPGQHWMAISVDGCGNGQFFDSFGRPPTGTFRDYLNKHCRTLTYNKIQLQSAASELCGQYCVVWCVFISRKVALSSLLSSVYTGLNDSIIRSIVERINISMLCENVFFLYIHTQTDRRTDSVQQQQGRLTLSMPGEAIIRS